MVPQRRSWRMLKMLSDKELDRLAYAACRALDVPVVSTHMEAVGGALRMELASLAASPSPVDSRDDRDFLHRLIENAFSWALRDCNYLNPKYMDRLIDRTHNGMKPEHAATWNAAAPDRELRSVGSRELIERLVKVLEPITKQLEDWSWCHTSETTYDIEILIHEAYAALRAAKEQKPSG